MAFGNLELAEEAPKTARRVAHVRSRSDRLGWERTYSSRVVPSTNFIT